MLLFKLALKNILGAGLKTWLNVTVLSLTFVIIIWHRGFFVGMMNQAESAMIDSELAGGQFWVEKYDPYDPLTIEDSHAKIPAEIQLLIDEGNAAEVLITNGSIYPEGRMQNILIKGITPQQTIVDLPTSQLEGGNANQVKAIIGKRTAEAARLKQGDVVTIRWRDANGTFDATDITIAALFSSSVPTVDVGQVWVSLEQLQAMMNLSREATIVTIRKQFDGSPLFDLDGWKYHDLDYLLKDIRDMVATKKISGMILHVILFSIALLAIFDTQMLSIFRRRKEMGTMMALGMTRINLIKLFTLEGAMYGFLAFTIACIYGIPLLIYSAVHGFKLPEATEQSGFAIGNTLYPAYPVSLIVSTTVILFLIIIAVSYYPARRIGRLNPTDALRGRMS